MAAQDDSILRAILGPTNTGKTHLAIERMCAHSSGVIGFPLRLLAREVYERVVAIKGESQVALLTGEERIVPPHARYVLCTAESMPVRTGRDARSDGWREHEGQFPDQFAFAAIDEAQLGSDPERGHVFTDRMLRVRGREETLILGADTLRPLIRELLPARRNRQPAAFFDLTLCRRGQAFATTAARAPSSRSAPSRSMRWPRCFVVSRAARRS